VYWAKGAGAALAASEGLAPQLTAAGALAALESPVWMDSSGHGRVPAPGEAHGVPRAPAQHGAADTEDAPDPAAGVRGYREGLAGELVHGVAARPRVRLHQRDR